MSAPRQPRRSPESTNRGLRPPRPRGGNTPSGALVVVPKAARRNSDPAMVEAPVGGSSRGLLVLMLIVVCIALLGAVVMLATGNRNSNRNTSTATANHNPGTGTGTGGGRNMDLGLGGPDAGNTPLPGPPTDNQALDARRRLDELTRQLRQLIQRFDAFQDATPPDEPDTDASVARRAESMAGYHDALRLAASFAGLIESGMHPDPRVKLDIDDMTEAWAGAAVDAHMAELEPLADPRTRKGESKEATLTLLRDVLSGKREDLMPAELINVSATARARLARLIVTVDREVPARPDPARSDRWWEPGPGSTFVRRESARYELTTDLPESYALLILRQLESFYPAWQAILAPAIKVPDTPPRRHRVRIFATMRDFLRFRHDSWNERQPLNNFVYRHSNDPSRCEMIGYLIAHDAFFATLRHEGFHQVLRQQIAWPAHWLNEGMAELVEESDVVDGRFVPRLHTGWARQVRRFIAADGRYRMVPMPELMQMTKAAWLRETGATYPLSWALAWYLQQKSGPDGRAILQRLLAAHDPTASEAVNVERCWKATFGPGGPLSAQLARVQHGYEELLGTIKPVADYEGFERASELVADRKPSEALPTLEKLVRDEPRFEPGFFYYGLALAQTGKRREALDALLRSVDLFPQYSSGLWEAAKLATALGYNRLAACLLEETIVHSRTAANQAASLLERVRGKADAPGVAPLPAMGEWPVALGAVPGSRFALAVGGGGGD